MEQITALVTMLAAILALFVTLDQLTAGTRLRRKVELWRTEAEALAGTYDAQIFWSLHRSGMAKIVAADAVPTKWPLLATSFGVILAWSLFDLGFQVGQFPQETRNWQGMQDAGMEPFFVLITPFLLGGQFAYVFHCIRERSEVERAFLARVSVLRPTSYNEAEFMPRPKERSFLKVSAVRVRLFSMALALGIVLLTFVLGFGSGLRKTGIPIEMPDWAGFFILGGCLALVAAFVGAVPAILEMRTDWKHSSPINESQESPEISTNK